MIVLASASPRRKELLSKIIPEFEISTSNIEESVPDDIKMMDAAVYLATQKALKVFKSRPNDIIIGADTIIVFNDKIYGKPIDVSDAKNMLKAFSGNTHLVITGVSIISNKRSISFSSINQVEFYNLSEKEIDDYLKNDEYKDKAGAYAIQGEGALFIRKIVGDYNGIVGLPVSELNRILKTFFNI